MQLIKGLFIAAVICAASVSAEQQETDKLSKSDPSTTNGFGMRQVGFASNDLAEEADEEDPAEKTDHTVFIVAAVAGCVCIGIIGAVFLKRRKDNNKLQGDIFTIDDKNSVL